MHPFWHPGDHFGSLGTPWGTMGAAGRTRGGPEPDCNGSEVILGLYFESFLNSDWLIFRFVAGLSAGHFLHRSLDGNPDRWSS